jgi:hypothetical protein
MKFLSIRGAPGEKVGNVNKRKIWQSGHDGKTLVTRSNTAIHGCIRSLHGYVQLKHGGTRRCPDECGVNRMFMGPSRAFTDIHDLYTILLRS